LWGRGIRLVGRKHRELQKNLTQAFAGRLAAAGYHGLIVRSFAPGAARDDANLVLWTWSDAAPCRLTLIHDEGRLSR
ncbi:RES domain-containing protein, partial [Shinella kummerowiae]